MSRTTKIKKKMRSSVVKRQTFDSTIVPLNKGDSKTQNLVARIDRTKSDSNLSSINHTKSPPEFIIIHHSDFFGYSKCILNYDNNLTNKKLVNHLIEHCIGKCTHYLKQVK